MGAGARWVSKQGQAATLREYATDTSEGNLDEYRTPSPDAAPTTTATSIVLELITQGEPVTVTAYGSEVRAEAIGYTPDVPSDAAMEDESHPEYVVGSETWVVLYRDTNGPFPDLYRVLLRRAR